MRQGPAPGGSGREEDPAREPGEPVPTPDPLTEEEWLAWCEATAGQDEPTVRRARPDCQAAKASRDAGAATCPSCARRTIGVQPSLHGIYPGPGIVPDPQVLQRHGHPGNLVVGRGAVTTAIGHDRAADRAATAADHTPGNR